jgi:hypothetical protein
MDVNVPDTTPKQGIVIDEMQDLWLGGDAGTRQIGEGSQHDLTLRRLLRASSPITKGWVRTMPAWSSLASVFVVPAQMIDPDGGIGQDHARVVRRRGGASRAGSLPPKRANRRALSRSIRALSASRTRRDFSSSPVKAWALATSSSSSASVVRIAASRYGTIIAPFGAIFNALERGVPIQTRQSMVRMYNLGAQDAFRSRVFFWHKSAEISQQLARY